MLRFPLIAITNQQLNVQIINYWRALILFPYLLLPVLFIHLVFVEDIKQCTTFSSKNPLRLYVLNQSNADTAYWRTLRNLPPQDYSRLFNISDFDFCMQQPHCGPQVKAVIMIPTAPGNEDRRHIIRSTWASVIPNTPTHPVRLIFVLGQTKSKTQQKQLENENTRFHDMVQGNFMDAYRNLTYKHLAILKWFIYRCAHAQFLIKLDDDCFLNTFLLYRFLNLTKESRYKSQMGYIPPTAYNFFFQGQQSIFCQKLHHNPVMRSMGAQFYVSYSEYSPEYYPDYCYGYAVIYPAGIVLRLYNASCNSKSFFWIEDIYFTGMLRERLHVPLVDSDALHLSKERYEKLIKVQQVPERAKQGSKIDTREYLFSWPEITPEEFQFLWQITCDKWRKRASVTIKNGKFID